MKAKKPAFAVLFPLLAFMILILDSKTAISGAAAGLELCIRSVIPALFPFLVVSVCLTGAISQYSLPWLRPLGRLCQISPGNEPIFLIGLLGGYPTGAQITAQRLEAGEISPEEARHLLRFTSNCGPAFLFGILSSQFPDRRCIWVLWLIQILSAVCTSRLLPHEPGEVPRPGEHITVTLPAAMKRALGAMTGICGWVILFRILLSFLQRWLLQFLAPEVSVLLTGLLELTNGCLSLDAIPIAGARWLLCAVMTCAGGLCVAMQTTSVTGGFGFRDYLLGKLTQTGICLLLAYPAQYFLFEQADRMAISPASGLPAIFLLIFSLFPRKSSGKKLSAVV